MFAHHPTGGNTPDTFSSGLLSGLAHPIIGIDHLIFLILLGILAYFSSKKSIKYFTIDNGMNTSNEFIAPYKWFYKKTEQVYNWAANRYGFEVLKSEDKWRKKYPNIAKKMDDLELKIKLLEGAIYDDGK